MRTIGMSPLKRIEQYILAIFKLGKIERLAKGTARDIVDVRRDIGDVRSSISGLHAALQDRSAERSELDGLNHRIGALEARHGETRDAVDGITRRIVASEKRLPEINEALSQRISILDGSHIELRHAYGGLTHQLDSLLAALLAKDQGDSDSHGSLGTRARAVAVSHVNGAEAARDAYYHHLENMYRGTLATIRKRLSIHLPDVEAAVLRTEERPVIDLGCGRGEWLDLLRDIDIKAIGVDINDWQVADAIRRGHDIRLQDACTALGQLETGSCAAITSFHLIEHLPFEAVFEILRQSRRVLAPGGLLLLETPNVRNIIVGATSFHNDPTHLRPYTSPALEAMLDSLGFTKFEARFLNPHERLSEFLKKPKLDAEVAHLLFGPQDMAILAQTPRRED